ncbi:MAG: hypothetical protein B7Z68_02675 [Acidobacteria bacterium 21-70-11]|nr:MAG: hypothetical protein B7Z68_02675 [Acidobacteria bacterium 21-70-11]HQU33369.1 glycosyltransferase [Thermoanaerobaculaceae bacterium]
MIQAIADSRPRFSVLVPVHNKAPVLRAVLTRLVSAVRSYGNAELIVVDHDSTDGSGEIVAALDPGPDIVVCSPVGTAAAARNLGAAHATGTHLTFVDADCVVTEDYLERLAEVVTSVNAAAVGGHVCAPVSSAWVADVWQRIHVPAGDGPRRWLSAAGLTVERGAFERVGGFDETKETQEDVEFCGRLRRAGYRIWGASALAVIHLDNPSTLAGFFRKEAWRATGAFDGRTRRGSDRPTLAMAVHLALVGGGAAVSIRGPGPEMVRLASTFALSFAVPSFTVAVRAWCNRRLYRPAAAVVLYQAYYLARVTALVQSSCGRVHKMAASAPRGAAVGDPLPLRRPCLPAIVRPARHRR